MNTTNVTFRNIYELFAIFRSNIQGILSIYTIL